MQTDELSVDLGVVRLQVQHHGIIPTKISLRWEDWLYVIPLWPEVGPTVAPISLAGEDRGGLWLVKESQQRRRDDRRNFGNRGC